MRKLLFPLCVMVGACSTVPVPGVCTTAATETFIGQPANQETGNAILKATHATTLRWAPPGVMLTMDFRADRVTVRTGPDGKISAINCG